MSWLEFKITPKFFIVCDDDTIQLSKNSHINKCIVKSMLKYIITDLYIIVIHILYIKDINLFCCT